MYKDVDARVTQSRLLPMLESIPDDAVNFRAKQRLALEEAQDFARDREGVQKDFAAELLAKSQTFRGHSDTLGQMNEAYNANRYIYDTITQEKARVDRLNAEARNQVLVSQQRHMSSAHRAARSRFLSRVFLYTLFAVMVLMVLVSAWMQGALSLAVFLVLGALALAVYAVYLAVLVNRNTRRRQVLWNQYYWQAGMDEQDDRGAGECPTVFNDNVTKNAVRLTYLESDVSEAIGHPVVRSSADFDTAFDTMKPHARVVKRGIWRKPVYVGSVGSQRFDDGGYRIGDVPMPQVENVDWFNETTTAAGGERVFEVPRSNGKQSAAIFEGTFVAPATGEYVFGFSCDDAGDLKVGPDLFITKYGRGGAGPVADNTASVELVQGKQYDFRARCMDVHGAMNGIAVGVAMPATGWKERAALRRQRSASAGAGGGDGNNRGVELQPLDTRHLYVYGR